MILHPVLSDNTITSLHPSAITAAVCAEVIFANTSPFGPLSTGCGQNMWRFSWSNSCAWITPLDACLFGLFGTLGGFCLCIMHLYVSSHRTASPHKWNITKYYLPNRWQISSKKSTTAAVCFASSSRRASQPPGAMPNVLCPQWTGSGYSYHGWWQDMTRYDKM